MNITTDPKHVMTGTSYQANFFVMPSTLNYTEDYFSKDDSIIRTSTHLYDQEALKEESY
jgi:hypothetical protein